MLCTLWNSQVKLKFYENHWLGCYIFSRNVFQLHEIARSCLMLCLITIPNGNVQWLFCITLLCWMVGKLYIISSEVVNLVHLKNVLWSCYILWGLILEVDKFILFYFQVNDNYYVEKLNAKPLFQHDLWYEHGQNSRWNKEIAWEFWNMCCVTIFSLIRFLSLTQF